MLGLQQMARRLLDLVGISMNNSVCFVSSMNNSACFVSSVNNSACFFFPEIQPVCVLPELRLFCVFPEIPPVCAFYLKFCLPFSEILPFT